MSEVKKELLEVCQGAPYAVSMSAEVRPAAGRAHPHAGKGRAMWMALRRRTRGVPEQRQQRLAAEVLAKGQA